MTNSQNGWPARATTASFTRFTAAGQGWWAANDDVAVVLGEFITRFDREVEEITGPVLDDWSYANRLVRGSTSIVSNHGSATAVDLNALQHPRGARNTLSAAKQKKMRTIKNAITDNAGRPVLALGLDFHTTEDDMHVEITAGARAVRQAADKIRRRNQQAAASQEDEVKDSDKADIAREVVRLLSGTANIPNQALHPGEPAAANFTLPGAVSNIEKNQDQENERTAADRLADSVTRKQVAEIHAAVVKAPAGKG